MIKCSKCKKREATNDDDLCDACHYTTFLEKVLKEREEENG